MDISTAQLIDFARKPCAAALLLFACASGAQAAECGTLLNRELPRLQDEKPQNLCQYAGKVVVVVNTASYCGFTSQYKGLESLHARYRDRGLVVLGFPSNDFGGQEPGSNQEIATFCANTFGVKFPMFTKTRVSQSAGAALSPLYAELRQRTGTLDSKRCVAPMARQMAHSLARRSREVSKPAINTIKACSGGKVTALRCSGLRLCKSGESWATSGNIHGL